MNSNAFVVTDKSLALEILMSDSFNVVDLKGYLNKLGSISGKSFTRLESFVSMSPFFNEGQLHQTLKKAMSLAFTRENLNYWKPFFESKIDELHNQLVTNFDVVDYSFKLAESLLRPLILGVVDYLPTDFEERMYNLQKVVEPMLSIRQLIELENELEYLLTHTLHAIKKHEKFKTNSLPDLMSDSFTQGLSEEDRAMMLIVLYGAKTPLIQTLSNIILEITKINRRHYVTKGELDSQKVLSNLDSLIMSSASLLHIHRVAQKSFSSGSFSVNSGDYILIRTRFTELRTSDSAKALGFGIRAHYCAGAQLAKIILSLTIPRLVKSFPNLYTEHYDFDPTIHTAQALKTLRVNYHDSVSSITRVHNELCIE